MAEVTLNSGHKMPMIAFGTFQIQKPATKQAVLDAIRAGYTHIDTASVYQNESEVGEALAELFSAGEKTRSDLYITTKVYMSKYRNIRQALLNSLQRLQLTYVDQYLLHWPIALEDDGTEPPQFVKKLDRYPLHLAWAQMEALAEEGLIKSIGVSNWTIALLNDMFGFARILPATNQIEINPYNKKTELVEYCLNNGVRPVAYRVIYRPVNDVLTDFNKCILDDPVVIEVSQKYGKTPAQVLQAWCLQRGCAVIIKTLSVERMRENFAVVDIKLQQEDFEKISALKDQGEYLENKKLFGFDLFK